MVGLEEALSDGSSIICQQAAPGELPTTRLFYQPLLELLNF